MRGRNPGAVRCVNEDVTLRTARTGGVRTRLVATVVAVGGLAATEGCASREARTPTPPAASSPTGPGSDVAKSPGTSATSATPTHSQPASSPAAAASLPPSPVAVFASAPAGFPRCAATAVTLRPDALTPETGEHGFTVWIINSGDSCVLIGYPSVRLLDNSGTSLPFTYHQGGGYATSQHPREVLLPTGARAVVIVAKYRCDSGPGQPATAVELALPGSAVSTGLEPLGNLAYCGPSDPGDDVYVSPIEPDVGAATNLGG